MSESRYDLLVGTLLEDGALPPAQAEELAAILRAEPARREDLRRQLVLWEVWAQQQAPERTGESFLAACRTRLRAEGESDRESFVAAVQQRVTADPRARWWTRLRVVAWAAPLAAAVLAMIVWLALPRAAQATTLRGEAICTACMLHESHDHRPVLRIQDGDTTRLCYLEANRPLHPEIGNYCSAPVPLDATGSLRTESGRLVMAVRALQRHAPPPASPPGDAKEPPVLFPF